MKKRMLVLALFCIGSLSFSQKIIQNQGFWFSYLGQYKVTKNFGYHVEAQFRLDNQLQQNNQNVFRIGGIYYKNEKLNFTFGGALVNTLEAKYHTFFKELRVWEQMQYQDSWNVKNKMLHRVRLEQRFIDELDKKEDNSIEKSGTAYQNRLRYLNRNLIHLVNFRSENEELYFVLQDEVFLNLGKNHFLAQNRFGAGMGVNYNNNVRFELTYTNQFINSNNGNDRMNHIISFSLFQNLNLKK